jgi:hypothetical protein
MVLGPDRPSSSRIPLGSDPLLATRAHYRAGRGLINIQKPPSQRSTTSATLPRNIPPSAHPRTTGLNIL